MNVGYIIASRQVTECGKPIGYMYREEPDDESDSGWRVFSGDETPDVQRLDHRRLRPFDLPPAQSADPGGARRCTAEVAFG